MQAAIRRGMGRLLTASDDDLRLPLSESSTTIEQHEFSNGLVLVGEDDAGRAVGGVHAADAGGGRLRGADGLNVGGGAATMVAEWITRGAGVARQPRAAHGARQPGRQPRRERPDPAHEHLGGDPGPQPDPGPGDLRRHGAPAPPRRRGGRADPGALPAEPAEPRGRPGHQGHLRAAAGGTSPTPGAGPRPGPPRGSPR